MMNRVPVIAGNWKMHLNRAEAIELVDGIRYGLPFPGEVDVIVAPSYLCLPVVVDHLKESYIGVAAQNMHFEEKGAFTGECSGSQLIDVGVDYVIIGHSERRQYYAETNETVNMKVKAALKNDLIPIVCIGETLEQRERGEVSRVIEGQLEVGLDGLESFEAVKLIIAYEPVWAIGTGKTATAEQVEEVHCLIRGWLAKTFGESVSDIIRILYGGSVKPANSKELMALPNVDGALVGGASLKPDDFIAIIKSCCWL
jgi:triosephosphate isomerase (TIM)